VSVVLSGQLVRMKTEVKSGAAVELPMARLGAWEVAGEEALRGEACERTLRASELTDLLQIDTAVYIAAITADREQVSDERRQRELQAVSERRTSSIRLDTIGRVRGPYRSWRSGCSSLRRRCHCWRACRRHCSAASPPPRYAAANPRPKSAPTLIHPSTRLSTPLGVYSNLRTPQ
jgi:hypothetical protein